MTAPLTVPVTRARWPRASLLASALAFALACANTLAADVVAVTDRRHPIAIDPGIRVIELDLPEQLIKSELAANLPTDPEKAATIVRQKLREGGAVFQKRLALAYQGVIEAWALGITKIPAVVVDRQYVVYGQPDVDRAVLMVEQYRSKQP